MTTQSQLKWRRIAARKYAAPTPCDHTVIATKWFRCWVIYFEGGYKLNIDYPTLAKAKSAAAGLLDTLRCGLERRQADEAAKAKAAAQTRVAGIIRQCRIADSKTPPAGIAWHDWAERFVGCTAAEVRAANRTTLADVLEDWHVDNYADYSLDDIRRQFTEW